MTRFNPSLNPSLNLSPLLQQTANQRDALIDALERDGFQITTRSNPDPRTQLIHVVAMHHSLSDACATIQVVPVTSRNEYVVQVLMSFRVTS